MKISFYVLSEDKAQDFLGFICQLTQTALNKSAQSLLILIEDEALLADLDHALWALDATSFIPHQCLLEIPTKQTPSTAPDSNNTDPQDTDPQDTNAQDINAKTTNPDTTTSKRLAPVLLGRHMPADFSGVVLNTTARPVSDFMTMTSNAKPSRALELIKPDARSVQEGRHKYKCYQQLGYELTHFKV